MCEPICAKGILGVKESIQETWNLHGAMFLHRGVFPSSPVPHHVQALTVNLGVESVGSGLSAKARGFQAMAGNLALQRPGSPSQSASPPTKSLQVGRASWPKVQAQQESGQRILSGRDLIETVRKVKAEELITPTGPEKGQ